MTDAIGREQMRQKLIRMKDRIRSHREGPYRCGYTNACNDALQKLGECDQLELSAITRCIDCRHCTEKESSLVFCLIHNRRRNPNDHCSMGEMEY